MFRMLMAMFVAFVLVVAPSDAATEGGADGAHAGHHDLGHGNADASLHDVAEFRTDLAIYTFVVFLLLLVLLGTLAWPKISAALEAREKAITDNIAAAQAMHDEAKQVLSQHEAKLAQAKDEVREMLEEARRDAEATKNTIVAEANQAAAEHRHRALRDIDQARDAAVRQLAEQSATLAVELAGKVVQANMTPERQAELVGEAMNRLQQLTPSAN
jgi:F-type H+-transporting ATPase subunit b